MVTVLKSIMRIAGTEAAVSVSISQIFCVVYSRNLRCPVKSLWRNPWVPCISRPYLLPQLVCCTLWLVQGHSG